MSLPAADWRKIAERSMTRIFGAGVTVEFPDGAGSPDDDSCVAVVEDAVSLEGGPILLITT
jgi:hypothetical protein